jgi:two-component system invasion response regulator UvrY
MIKVILCDDHAMIRRGIRDTLAEAVDIQVTAEAGSYAEVREAIRSNPCDVLLLDINLPGRGGSKCSPVCTRVTPRSRC